MKNNKHVRSSSRIEGSGLRVVMWTVTGGEWTVTGGEWTVTGGEWTVAGGIDRTVDYLLHVNG